MELLYVYIDKYRNFAKQEIHFSNKFKIRYSESDKKLSIQKNEDYIDIYPKNIVGVTAIVGKNASGKTSLLDLVGTRIGNRSEDRGIIKSRQKDPHILIPILQEIEKGIMEGHVYDHSYFLVYYLGVDDNKQNLFTFETNNPLEYIHIFSNAESIRANNEDGLCDIGYFASKAWFPYVFTKSDDSLILKHTLELSPFGSDGSITSTTCMLLFKNNFTANSLFDSLIDEDEYIMPIKRRYAVLKSDLLYNQIKFLIKQMNTPSSDLYKDKEYKLDINLKSAMEYYERNQDIKAMDYRCFDLKGFDECQKITLAFICGFTNYLFHESVRDDTQKLVKPSNDVTTYIDIKNYYHQIIETLLNNIKMVYDIDIILNEFKDAEEALENLFINKLTCNIKTSYKLNQFTLSLNKDTKIELIEPFFTNCLDERINKNYSGKDSVMKDYVSSSIHHLSEGEKANLALYTSIDEQLTMHTAEKKNYILVFDEMEQSMHPEMCRKLLSSLMEFLSSYKEKSFQIIIASHSPFVISDIRKENIICLRRADKQIVVKPPEENTFGQNIHTLLKNEFFLDNTYGEYSRHFIQKIASWLKEKVDLVKEINDFINSNLNIARIEKEISNLKEDIAKIQERDSELVSEIEAIQKNIARLESDLVTMQEHDAMLKKEKINQKVVVSNPMEAKAYLGRMIDSIGEPILRNYLTEKFYEYLVKYMSIDEQIEQHEDEIKKLRARKGGDSQ